MKAGANVRLERCELCQTPYEDDPNDSARYKDECTPCQRMEEAFKKRFGVSGDANYICHELAHFVMCYRTIPRYRRDWYVLERLLEERKIGRAQVHEMRTLALQGLAYIQLGWRVSWKRLVSLSWPGLSEVGLQYGAVMRRYEPGHGELVVFTETAARREVQRYRAHTSQKKTDLLALTIASFRIKED